MSDIAFNAATKSWRTYRKPLFVEDTGFYISALNGFPGSYSAQAWKSVGSAGIIKLLHGVHNRKAKFVTAVVFVDGTRQILFTGELDGTIIDHPTTGWGFESLFIPDGMRSELGQMSLAEKAKISHRAQALRKLGKWLEING